MILGGEVAVLIPNPEQRNFAHWLNKYHEEIASLEEQIETEKKKLFFLKDRMANPQSALS